MFRNGASYLVAGLALSLVGCGMDVVQPDASAIPEPLFDFTASQNVCAGPPTAKGAPGPGWPYIYGTPGNDKLVADEDYAVLIYGRAGNDCLVGGAPNNSLFGEDGDDVLLGGGGDDYLAGGPGADTMRGDDGDDVINAGDGAGDVVQAGAGDDEVYAQDGAVDEIDCGDGYDVAFVDADDVVRNCEVVNPWGSL